MNENLKKLQKIELDIFKEFKRICDKHNLKYYLLYGTCIGAVRHKGFIPWDDDIDVGMPREDFEKFKEVVKIELDSNYFFQDYFTDPKCGFMFSKLRKNNTLLSENYSYHIDMHQGVWIDIFIIDKMSNNKIQRFIDKLLIFFYRNVYIVKCGYKMPENRNKILYILYFILKVISKFFTLNYLVKQLDKTLKKHMNEDCTHAVEHVNPNIIFPISYLDDVLECDFEDTIAYIFTHYDEYLTNKYGNYMELPPIEKRGNGSFHIIKEFKEEL